MKEINVSTIIKAKSDYWFVGFYSNNYEDRQGEILTKAAHEAYAQFVTDSGIRPPITLLHQPRIPDVYFRAATAALVSGIMPVDRYNLFLKEVYKDYAIAEADMVLSIGGFNIVVGKVYEDRIPVVEKMLKSGIDWRMSHGFIPLSKDDNIINKYISVEFSSLPGEMAANLLTASNFVEKTMEQKLTAEQSAMLKDILGDGNLESTEDVINRIQPLLNEILPSKSLEEEEVEVKEVDEYEQLKARLFKDLDVDGLQAALKSFNDALVTLTSKIEEKAQQSEDEIIAKAMTPAWPMFKDVTGTTDKEVIDDLKEKGHTGDTPTNMLDAGFWSLFNGGQQ